MTDQIQRITTKGIFAKDGKVLFLQDPRGSWELPGGKIIFQEAPEETLEREIREELNINSFSIGDIVSAWTFVVSRDGNDCQFIVLVYACTAVDEISSHSEEHISKGWFSLEEIEKMDVRDGYKNALRKYFSRLKT
ncbi:MAG: NUDIX hydrolase [Candidatus Kerfeldbacteria bacterium]|nr:NUDIX hydrolase [Candidatus Kerfeldbacteria bacterium]